MTWILCIVALASVVSCAALVVIALEVRDASFEARANATRWEARADVALRWARDLVREVESLRVSVGAGPKPDDAPCRSWAVTEEDEARIEAERQERAAREHTKVVDGNINGG